MLKTKIIAADIQNLTDARYFAAWLVDYMSFDLSEDTIDLDNIKEIMDWVEGPIFIANYSNSKDSSLIEQQLHTLSLDHIIIGPNADEAIKNSDWEIINTIDLDEGFVSIEESRKKYIATSALNFSDIKENVLHKLQLLCSTNEIYLDCDFTVIDLDKILSLGIKGLVLRGGEEEKVGVKTYENLDEILEALEN